jgi:hypothetical protein
MQGDKRTEEDIEQLGGEAVPGSGFEEEPPDSDDEPEEEA